jgi:hypothetical protein
MSSFLERGTEAARQERSIASLADRTAVSEENVRGLFVREYARLELNAKVRTYLQVLTTSNVRSMLRATRGSTPSASGAPVFPGGEPDSISWVRRACLLLRPASPRATR